MKGTTPRGDAKTAWIIEQIEYRLDAILRGDDAAMRDAIWKLRLNLTDLRGELEQAVTERAQRRKHGAA